MSDLLGGLICLETIVFPFPDGNSSCLTVLRAEEYARKIGFHSLTGILHV